MKRVNKRKKPEEGRRQKLGRHRWSNKSRKEESKLDRWTEAKGSLKGRRLEDEAERQENMRTNCFFRKSQRRRNDANVKITMPHSISLQETHGELPSLAGSPKKPQALRWEKSLQLLRKSPSCWRLASGTQVPAESGSCHCLGTSGRCPKKDAGWGGTTCPSLLEVRIQTFQCRSFGAA